MNEIPAYPDEECQGCDHFCLDFSTPILPGCIAKQTQEVIDLYLSFIGYMPRPLIQEDDYDSR